MAAASGWSRVQVAAPLAALLAAVRANHCAVVVCCASHLVYITFLVIAADTRFLHLLGPCWLDAGMPILRKTLT